MTSRLSSHRLFPQYGYIRAFEDAFVLLTNSETIPEAPGHIPALDADLFKNFVLIIMQLVWLIRALEVLVVRGFATSRGEQVLKKNPYSTTNRTLS
jgi:hypothetical protein